MCVKPTSDNVDQQLYLVSLDDTLINERYSKDKCQKDKNALPKFHQHEK